MNKPAKAFASLLLFAFIFSITFSQPQGKVLEQKIVKSTILSRDVKYTAYPPTAYKTSERTCSVAYLLHGYTYDNTGWLQFGEVNRYADKTIAEGTIPPVIMVM